MVHLLSLPNELLIEILEISSREAAVCLALTCHQLYNLLITGPVHLRHPPKMLPTQLRGAIRTKHGHISRRMLLPLLEAGLPNHLLCSWCLKFHRLTERHDGNPVAQSSDGRSRSRSKCSLPRTERTSNAGTRMGLHKPKRFCVDCGGHGMPTYMGGWHYHQLDLVAVLARARHGPTHGLPLSILEVSTSWMPGWVDINNRRRFLGKVDIEPRIMETPKLPELHMHVVQRVLLAWNGPSDHGEVRPPIDSLNWDVNICTHMSLSDILFLYGTLFTFMQPRRHNASRQTWQTFTTEVTTCDYCKTQAQATLHSHPPHRQLDPSKGTLEIVVNVWHNLGCCSPHIADGWWSAVHSGSFSSVNDMFLPASRDGWREPPGMSGVDKARTAVDAENPPGYPETNV